MSAYQLKPKWAGLDTKWMRRGGCAGLTIEAQRQFFQDERTTVAAKRDTLEAKLICEGCTVRQTCLEFALAAGMIHVWGGTSTMERKVMLRQARVRHRGRDLSQATG